MEISSGISIFRSCDSKKWTVLVLEELTCFSSPDDAFNFVEELGISCDESDVALVTMLANNHTRAQFGVAGMFMFSDDALPPNGGTA
mgnify:FL=1